MAQHEYKCQSCFHKDVCPEYHPQTYSCVHHIDEADVAPREELAREIFEEIEVSLNLNKCYGDSGIYYEHDLEVDISELKKKYTEGSDNEAD